MLRSRPILLVAVFCAAGAMSLGWLRCAHVHAVRVASPWSPETLAGRVPGKTLSRVQVAGIMTTFCRSIGQPVPSISPASIKVGGDDIDLPYKAPGWIWRSHETVIQVADGSGIIVKYSNSTQDKAEAPATRAAIIARAVFILQRAGVYSDLAAQPNLDVGHHALGDGWTLFWPKKGAGSDEHLNGVLLILSPSGDLFFLKVDCNRPGDVVIS